MDKLKGDDPNFELIASNTLQPVRLARKHKVVTRSVAIIFAHSYTGGTLDDDTLIGGKSWRQFRAEITSKDYDDYAFFR